MRKGLFIFLRVIFVLALMMGLSFLGLAAYFNIQTYRALERAEQDTGTSYIGHNTAQVTIVEFFDYRCSHCQEMHKVLHQATHDDDSVRILLRPVMIADHMSMDIASFVLGLDQQKQGATALMHKTLMGMSDIPDYDRVLLLAEAQGINVALALEESQKHRQTVLNNTQLVQDIGFYGVPALVIDGKGVFPPSSGMPSVNEIKLMILETKKNNRKAE